MPSLLPRRDCLHLRRCAPSSPLSLPRSLPRSSKIAAPPKPVWPARPHPPSPPVLLCPTYPSIDCETAKKEGDSEYDQKECPWVVSLRSRRVCVVWKEGRAAGGRAEGGQSHVIKLNLILLFLPSSAFLFARTRRRVDRPSPPQSRSRLLFTAPPEDLVLAPTTSSTSTHF